MKELQSYTAGIKFPVPAFAQYNLGKIIFILVNYFSQCKVKILMGINSQGLRGFTESRYIKCLIASGMQQVVGKDLLLLGPIWLSITDKEANEGWEL